MNGFIPLACLIVCLCTYIASFWISDRDIRRQWRATSTVLAVIYAFSLAWAVWK